eukprot:1977144-Lingulodinium_polyedra.AAC.1
MPVGRGKVLPELGLHLQHILRGATLAGLRAVLGVVRIGFLGGLRVSLGGGIGRASPLAPLDIGFRRRPLWNRLVIFTVRVRLAVVGPEESLAGLRARDLLALPPLAHSLSPRGLLDFCFRLLRAQLKAFQDVVHRARGQVPVHVLLLLLQVLEALDRLILFASGAANIFFSIQLQTYPLAVVHLPGLLPVVCRDQDPRVLAEPALLVP